ncbi:MAG TPA: hypothetical protein HA254_02330 [Candidatus Diapherotrites archaeon]|uniref:RidA family protein n=1 Tax=Candidatus Iainarchaeum sp. TaxID=3101447 RepID=A0A7J4IXC6_9ARCH|nr:hypothetical protein [Candidatus Diapherotrites archaeon]
MAEIWAVRGKSLPKPAGPYSHATDAAGFIFVSGQLPLDPAIGKIVQGKISEHASQALSNIEAVLGAAGAKKENIVRVDVFLKNLNDAKGFNEIYVKWLGNHRPARQMIEAAGLPGGSLIEISCIAYAPK